MENASHCFVQKGFSTTRAAARDAEQARRLILMGLATAMALATFAPLAVLAVG